MLWAPVRNERGEIVRMEHEGARVRDGRHLMENDGGGDYRLPANVPVNARAVRFMDAVVVECPEHPNYRYQYDRVGDATV